MIDIHSEVRRIRGFFDPPPDDGCPWIADCRSFDIPETVVGMILQAAPGMVAITLSRRGGAAMIDLAEKAAASRGARVLWWNGLDDVAQLESAISEVCQTAISAKQ